MQDFIKQVFLRELVNTVGQIENLQDLFQGSTNVTIPITLHQDMFNTAMLEEYLKSIERAKEQNANMPNPPILLKNGCVTTFKEADV